MKTVAELMSRQVYCLRPEHSLQAALTMFEERMISGAPVVEASGSVVGVLSRSDLITSMARQDDFHTTPVGERMTPFVFHGRPDQSLLQLLEMMTTSRIHRVAVVDEANRPLGMVTTLDLLKEYLASLQGG